MGFFNHKDLVKVLQKHRRGRRNDEDEPTRYSNNPRIQQFFEEHGEPIRHDKGYLFQDGAFIEVTPHGYGEPMEPPEDEWECAKLIETYWLIKAKADEGEFIQFKGYLNGTGYCPPGINSDKEKLEHLRTLKAKATRSRTKLREAKQATKENKPAWLTAKEREEASASKRKQEFLKQVNDVRL